MKLTALVPDDLIKQTVALAKGKNTTESLIIALREWVAQKELLNIAEKIQRKPLRFAAGDIATRIRKKNRQSS